MDGLVLLLILVVWILSGIGNTIQRRRSTEGEERDARFGQAGREERDPRLGHAGEVERPSPPEPLRAAPLRSAEGPAEQLRRQLEELASRLPSPLETGRAAEVAPRPSHSRPEAAVPRRSAAPEPAPLRPPRGEVRERPRARSEPTAGARSLQGRPGRAGRGSSAPAQPAGLTAPPAPRRSPRSASDLRDLVGLSREELRRALVLQDVLGPPLSLRGDPAGPPPENEGRSR